MICLRKKIDETKLLLPVQIETNEASLRRPRRFRGRRWCQLRVCLQDRASLKEGQSRSESAWSRTRCWLCNLPFVQKVATKMLSPPDASQIQNQIKYIYNHTILRIFHEIQHRHLHRLKSKRIFFKSAWINLSTASASKCLHFWTVSDDMFWTEVKIDLGKLWH